MMIGMRIRKMKMMDEDDKMMKLYGKIYLDPTVTELLGSIPGETTDISSDHGNPKQPRIEHRRNRVGQIRPSRRIIASPVSRVLPRADKR